MKLLAAALAAAALLAFPAAASAAAARDAALARRGITHAVQRHWLKPEDAQRYRAAVARAMYDIAHLPKLRAGVLTSQLSQATTLWDSYTAPRALALFSQLEENASYLETNRIPPPMTDVADDEGVVYRWFSGLGLEFHPLANFAALNTDAAANDVEATRTLAAALLARAIPRGGRLLWEYSFPYGIGRPPWASGMAQAVAAQALARAGALLEEPALVQASAAAFASVQPLTFPLPSGPWVRLYGFNREVVLNAQLQAIVSLLDYAQVSGDSAASGFVQSLGSTTQALLPRFDTGDWSLYELGGGYAPMDYEILVTQLLAKLAARTHDPFWVDTAQRFHAYLYDPPQITPGTPQPSTLYPQPADGWLDTASIPITLSQRSAVTLAVGGKVTTYRLAPGAHTLTWKPPLTLAPGTDSVQLSATNYVRRRATVKLPPLVVAAETAPQTAGAQLAGTTLTWQFTDPGTPWLALKVDLADPTGATPPQVIDLAHQPTAGSAQVPVPPGTWQATLEATNSAALTTTADLGTVTVAG